MNTVELTDSEGQTALALTVTYPTKEARDAALATGMTAGMDQSFDRLNALLKKRR